MLRDTGLGWHRVSASVLLLGNIILVCEGLLLLEGGLHVSACVHIRSLLWHGTALLRWEVLRGGLFRGLDGTLVINTVLAISGRFGSVQASLG